MMIFRSSIQKWDEILLSMTQIQSDEILEGLYKLRIRQSEKLKTVLELYIMEIHQKKAGPDYHRLKTMVKRSIEQDMRNKNFGAEMENLKQAPWSRILGQNSVDKELSEIVGNGKLTGSVRKEDSCSFRHDMNKRAKSTQPHPAECGKCIENQKSWRQKPKWENGSTAVQGLPQRNLRNSIL